MYSVHKFGGASLATAASFVQVCDLIEHHKAKYEHEVQAVVVSAIFGITDNLYNATLLAKNRDPTYLEVVERLVEKNIFIAKELLDDAPATIERDIDYAFVPATPDSQKHCWKSLFQEVESIIVSDAEDLKAVLRGIFITQTYSEHILEVLSGLGELWSSLILHRLLEKRKVNVRRMDARKVLVVEHSQTGPTLCCDASSQLLQKWLKERSCDVIVITGYVAMTADGTHTTLGRNGSDLSAALFSYLFCARMLCIWKEVDGVYTADPRIVPKAKHLNRISYAEATELSYFGAKVLHSLAMAPVVKKQIPVWVRNANKPECDGTYIASREKIEELQNEEEKSRLITGLSVVNNVALVNLEGLSIQRVAGVSERMFRALADKGINVLMISQAGSEHSICIAVHQSRGTEAAETVREAFKFEINVLKAAKVEQENDQCILAAVGDCLRNQIGIAGKFFHSLSHAKVNVRAIAQGCSETNISVIISNKDAAKALQAVHEELIEKLQFKSKVVCVGIIGVGTIGGALVDMLLKQTFDGYKIEIVAISNSKRSVIWKPYKFLQEKNWRDLFNETGNSETDYTVSNVCMEDITKRLKDCVSLRIMVDCTSNQIIADHYPAWLAANINVATPNKKGFSGNLDLYKSIVKNCAHNKSLCLHEATVGAGLPVVQTVHELFITGHQISSIEGVFSGTLSYLFNEYSKGEKSFSQIVKDAKDLGYTEPDPRDDLSGLDAARKVVILAREFGIAATLEKMNISSLVPENLRQCDADTFMKKLPEYDHDMKKLLDEANLNGKVLRYVGKIDVVYDGDSIKESSYSLTLQSYPVNSPLGQLSGTDNIVAIYTRYYDKSPMVIKGPGAGIFVTATAVLADILKICNARH